MKPNMQKQASAVRHFAGCGEDPRIKSTYTIDAGRALRVRLKSGVECVVPVTVLVALAHELTMPTIRAAPPPEAA